MGLIIRPKPIAFSTNYIVNMVATYIKPLPSTFPTGL